MALTLKKFRISCPSKSSKEWASDATIIKQGEFVHDSDLDRVKIGDGTKTFSQLPWAYLSASEIQTLINAHANRTDNPHKVSKSQVGLSNVENKTVAQILASAALTGTPTAPTAVTGVSNTQIANTQYVNTAISNAIAASDAMIFKGTLGTGGTITALPKTYKTGWTYRVVSAGSYAGQQCEIGDLVIALVDRSGSGNVNSDWTVAQTNINGAITSMSGSNPIQVTGSGSSRNIQHMASGVTAGTYRSVTVNNMGHVIDGSNPVTDIAEGGTNNTSFTNNTVIIYDGNKLASSGVSTTKLNYLSTVTSDIQTQLNGKAASSHTHNYAGSSSAGGPANSVKANMVVKLNNGTTEGTNMFTFNGSAAKTVNITPSSIGAAAVSHGTHVSFGTTAPKANGTASAGSATTVSRSDHVHPLQTSVSGNAGTATKLATARTITLTGSVTGSGTFDGSGDLSITTATNHAHNYAGSSSAGGPANSVKANMVVKLNNGTTEGTNMFTFNGSTAKTINITAASIGAVSGSHTHNYAGSSSAGGPANSVKANMVVKLNGGTTEGINQFTFNGSAAKSVNITASSIGAAASTHTHNYAGSSSPGGAATSANKVNSTLTIRRKMASSTSTTTDYSTMATFNGASAVNLTLDPLGMESAGLMVGNYEYSGGESGGTGAEIFNDYRYTNGYHNNKATGDYSSAHGSLTNATGNYSTAMGYKSTASGSYSFAVGNSCTAGSGAYTMALGTNSVASGVAAFAAGNSAQATGSYSVSLGNGTIAAASNQTVVGSYNSSSSSTANRFIVGGGDSSTRSNAMRVNTSGQVFGTGAFVSSGADYAELFEWEDGNPNDEDRRGLFVTLNGKYIAIANSSDEYILGIISSNPCIIGDSQSEEWHGKYVRDEFGQIVTEDVLVPTITDENGIVIQEEHTEEIAIISEDFDDTKTYIPRLERSEWDAVGLLGKLIVKDDGSADVNDYLTTTTGGIGTKSTRKTRFRVMERLDDNLVMVIYK